MNLSAVNRYVGLPYRPGGRSAMGVDCYGLVMLLYLNEFDIALPDFMSAKGWEDIDSDIAKYTVIATPTDFCIVRSANSLGLADHVGVYVSGCVLSAEKPSSQLIPLDRWVKKHPMTEFAVISLSEEVLH